MIESYQRYQREVPTEFHARSLSAVRLLAGLRGRHVGLPQAEAFTTIVRVDRA